MLGLDKDLKCPSQSQTRYYRSLMADRSHYLSALEYRQEPAAFQNEKADCYHWNPAVYHENQARTPRTCDIKEVNDL